MRHNAQNKNVQDGNYLYEQTGFMCACWCRPAMEAEVAAEAFNLINESVSTCGDGFMRRTCSQQLGSDVWSFSGPCFPHSTCGQAASR
ncbi:MAG TPA: hypothetical protein VLC92_18015 [Rhodocyclaceae bacterium]|nr:hypothetical protein [Rhodocyclaceae bacterium]